MLLAGVVADMASLRCDCFVTCMLLKVTKCRIWATRFKCRSRFLVLG